MRDRWLELRRGITRTVLLVGRWAVKFPSLRSHGNGLRGLLWSWTRGVQANLAEHEWQKVDEALCPVRWSLLGGVVQVYPRCVPIPITAEGEPAVELPVLAFPFGDDKPQNWGLLDGRVVRVDYDTSYNGCPHDPLGLDRLSAAIVQERSDG